MKKIFKEAFFRNRNKDKEKTKEQVFDTQPKHPASHTQLIGLGLNPRQEQQRRSQLGLDESSRADKGKLDVSIRYNTENIPADMISIFENGGKDIAENHRRYRKEQAEHLAKSKKEILETADAAVERLPQGQSKEALLLGVGPGTDYPLQKLAEQFDHLTVIELDEKGTRSAIEQLPLELRGKFNLVIADTTGIIDEYCQKIKESLNTSSSLKSF
jgi:hypothetical protein